MSNPRQIDLTCKELVEIATEYLAGGLSAEDRALLEQHLLICADCVRYVEQMRTTAALTGKLREDDVSPEMVAALGGAFRRWKERGSPR